jgi:hypothetical protein
MGEDSASASDDLDSITAVLDVPQGLAYQRPGESARIHGFKEFD